MKKEITQSQVRARMGLVSLVVSALVMGLKFYAYRKTNSTAIFSDALESVINVIAAVFTAWALRAADSPPDPEHPYGHGKLEFVTSIFEGGLISYAALLICYEAISHLIFGVQPQENILLGIQYVLVAGIINLALGMALLWSGKTHSSMALVAEGKHILTDCASSAGVILALILVNLSGISWIDPAMALLMGLLLAYTGIPLVKEAIDGLIDAADGKLLSKILQSIEKNRKSDFISVHHVRAMRNGRRIHVDGHVVIPEFWTVEEAHDRTVQFERSIVKDAFIEGEIEFHMDPCRREYCIQCEIGDCPIRVKPFQERKPLTIQQIISVIDITDRPKLEH